ITIDRAPARAAIFLGPEIGEPALPIENALPFERDAALDENRGGARRGVAQVVGQGLFEEGSPFRLEGALLGRVVEVHQSGFRYSEIRYSEIAGGPAEAPAQDVVEHRILPGAALDGIIDGDPQRLQVIFATAMAEGEIKHLAAAIVVDIEDGLHLVLGP